MVNYHDPITMARDYTAMVKVWHVVDGIFIWEFFTTLDFEWDVIRGKRPYRWTIWVYSVARVSTLLAVIINMIGFDTTIPINCQASGTSDVVFAYIAFATSSLLIVLRVIAIWNRQKIIFGITMAIWMTDVAFLINGIPRIHNKWSPELNTCTVINFDSTKSTIVTSLVTDILLLLIMLIGLLRMRLEGGGFLSLGRILCKQGLIWLLLATVAEVPSSTFVILNLNVPLDLLPQTPSMIIVTIAATRMYRSLINIFSENPHDGLGETVPTVSDMRVRPGPIARNPMEVSVRSECEQYPSSQMGRFGYLVSTEPPDRYKAHEVSFNGDVESGQEK